MNLYILKCENNKYYVGTTTLNTTTRLTQHMSGRGSAWTKKHPPLWIEKEITNCDKYDEDKWTKIYMDKYGIDNVRGGSYSQISLPNNMINLLEREVNHANQNCLSCGKKGHFINRCPSREKPINKKYKSKNLYYLNMSCDYESADGISYDSNDSDDSDESYYSEDSDDSEDSDNSLRSTQEKSPKKGGCYRCGRNGHYASKCYAKKHIKGFYIKN